MPTPTRRRASISKPSSIRWSAWRARARSRRRWTRARPASCSTSRCWSSPAAGGRRSIGCSWWTARPQTQVDRVVARSGLKPEEVRAIMAAQAQPQPAAGRRGHRDLQRGPDARRNCVTTWQQRGAPLGAMMALPCATPRPPSVILYEYPFNERIRTYLRLEHLFRRLGELVPRDRTPSTITTPWPRSSRSWTWRRAPTSSPT